MASSIDTRRRVKHYVLNDSRQWIDQGTGHVSWHYNKRAVSLVVKSETDGSTLLDSKIQLTIVYQRQQDTLIVWSDPSRRDQALSFQEKAGCDEVWEKICEVLGEDASLDTTSSRGSGEANNGGGGVTSSSGGGGGGGGGGSRGSSLQEIEGEEEREEETDNNLSPGDELPPCELARLKDIRDYFTCEVPRRSKRYKDRLSAVIESDSYINRLIDMFHTCEDLENEDGLHYLYEIFRCLFYLNKSSLLDILLNEEFIMDVIGCLEYDPNKPEPIRHREYITSKSRFKEIISFENSELVNRIHQTYKVQYIQDVILPAPSVFENSLTALTSYIFLNKVEISNLIQEDERFLNELFENLRNLQANSEKHQEMLEFLREYTGILHGLQQARDPFFKSLFDHGLLDVIELGLSFGDDKMSQTCVDILSHFVEVSPASVREYILKEIEAKSSVSNLNMSLKPATSSSNSNSSSNNNSNSSNHINVTITSSKFPTSPIVSVATTASSSSSNIEVSTTTNNNDSNEQERKSSIDTTEQQEQQQQHQREETSDHDDINESVAMLSLSDILNTDDVFEPILINYVIKQMFNDTDPELGGALQIVNLLKLLIDPENMLSVANKSEKTEFLAYFYRKSMGILIAPLLANTSGGQIHREDFLVAQLQNLILDFLSFCVEHHTNHIKSYMVNKDLLKQILVLLKSRHQFLALSALRFLRKTISLKEEIYNKYIVKSNLLEPVVEALKTNASRYNILNSAVIELFDFIRTEDIKTLMNHVVETYYPYLDSINYVKTFRDLKLRYEQHKERYSDQFSRSRLSNEDSTPSLYRSRGIISDRFRVDYDKNDEDAWIEEDEEEQQIHQRQSSSEGYLSINGGLGPTATQVNGDGLGMGDHASNTATDSSSSSSSSSSSNGGGDLNQPVADSSEFIDYKRHHLLHHHHRHGDEDEEESEETLFAPVKSTVVSSSTQQTATTTNHHHHGGSSIKTSTISIKINTTSLRSLATTTSNHVGEHNEAESSLSPGGANNSTSSLSPSSNPSTPSSALSPLCTKKALVDYEYDSDEEEEKEEIGEEKEEEKNKNQQSIESKTEKVDEQEEQEEKEENENEEKEERPESSTTKSASIDEAKINNKTAPIIDTSPPLIESSSSNKVIEEASSSSSLSPHRENIDSPEINGQIEPANKRARLSST